MKILIIFFVNVFIVSFAFEIKNRDYYQNNNYNRQLQYLADEYRPIQAMRGMDKKQGLRLEDAPQLFEAFIRDYNKQYKDQQDYMVHYQNFVKNLEEIIQLNEEDSGASFEINMFADLSDDELNPFTG